MVMTDRGATGEETETNVSKSPELVQWDTQTDQAETFFWRPDMTFSL